MLKECLETFEKQYSKYGDALIIDNYKLEEGSYVKVMSDDSYTIDNIDKNADQNSDAYFYFASRDYYSKLLAMNKPIDAKKQIKSNNYLTFFINKEEAKKKVTAQIIDGYYAVLEEPRLKYKNKKSKALYDSVELICGKPDKKAISAKRKWIETYLWQVLEETREVKGRLKIFFDETVDVYENEGKRYILPNIYNSVDYNIEIEGSIYGVPNNNLGMNSKKPFLEHKSRKQKSPYLINGETVLLQKKFFDYLLSQVAHQKYDIYFDDDKFYCLKLTEKLHKTKFEGYYLRLQKGMEAEIHDFERVYISGDETYKIRQVISTEHIKEKKINYDEQMDTYELISVINELYFNKFLINNYYTPIKDIKINDGVIKMCLTLYREAFKQWHKKGDDSQIRVNFKKMSLKLIKNTVMNGYNAKATEQFNIMASLSNYWKIEGGESMADQLAKITEDLRQKVRGQGYIENDQEYAFAVGQLVNYYISKNKSSKKVHALINPIMNCKNDQRIKEELKKLFKKYNHDIEAKYKRFNNLQSMVFGYDLEEKIDETMLLAGYLHASLIYEKEGDQ